MPTMSASQAKSRFEWIWRSIVGLDSQPQLSIPVVDANAGQTSEASLAAHLGTGEVWVDSAALENRPLKLQHLNASTIFAMHPRWEFVVLCDGDGSYWAILEEEYQWLVFVGMAPKAEQE